MSYIIRKGNLTSTPELKQGPKRVYTHARVLVTDTERDRETGEFRDTATTGYNLTVFGSDAESLVRTAQESGNVRVMFTGDYSVHEYTRQDGGTGIDHRVTVDDIGVSLTGQHVTVERKGKTPATTEADNGPRHPFEDYLEGEGQ